MAKKRICLVGAYDKQGIVDDYAVYQLLETAKFADIYYLCDNDLKKSELDKVKPFTKFAAGKAHGHYDFGSWARLIKEIGYKKLEQYDEVILMNDSCFGPVSGMKDMFEVMDAKGLDAWGMCGNKFMMSFFMVLSKKVVQSAAFKGFFDNINKEKNKSLIIKKYEQGINNVIQDSGFTWDVYISDKGVKEFYRKNKKKIWNDIKAAAPLWARPFVKLAPNKVRLYDDDFILPLMMGMPLVKRVSLYKIENILPVYYRYFIGKYTDYDADFIANHFARYGGNPSLGQRILARVKDKVKRFIHDEKYRKDKHMYRIFTIPYRVERISGVE